MVAAVGVRLGGHVSDAHAALAIFYSEYYQAKLDSARASGTNTLGKLALVKASQTTRSAVGRPSYIANDDPHRKATACPALAAVHTPES